MPRLQLSEENVPKVMRRPLWHFYVTGTLILLFASWLWWVKVYTAPAHVFWSMLETSLSTKSYVTEIQQSDGKNSIRQTVHVDTQAAMARSLTQLRQDGTEVKKEIIGTRTADYTRFLNILPAAKSIDAPIPDTSKIINIWAKSDETWQQSETATSGHQLYAQSALGIGLPVGSVPVAIADFSPRDRKDTIQRIRSENIYVPDFKNVRKERKNRRQIYTYDVQVQTILYIRLMQALAKHLHVSELDQVDPNTYGGGQPVRVRISVDALSHQLTAVDTGQGLVQTYSGYGIPLKTAVPGNAISTTELQRRLNELEK